MKYKFLLFPPWLLKSPVYFNLRVRPRISALRAFPHLVAWHGVPEQISVKPNH